MSRFDMVMLIITLRTAMIIDWLKNIWPRRSGGMPFETMKERVVKDRRYKRITWVIAILTSLSLWSHHSAMCDIRSTNCTLLASKAIGAMVNSMLTK